MKRLLTLRFFGLILIGISTPHAAELIPTLRFSTEDALNQPDLVNRDPSRPLKFSLTMPGIGSEPRTLRFTADKGSQFDVSLSPRTRSTGRPADAAARSLAFTLNSDRDENAKDKIMLNVVPFNTPNALTITDPGREQFFGFDILFDEGYQVSPFWTIHFQAWQCCGGHPPLTINVRPSRRPNAPILLDLSVINDDTEARSYGHGFTIASVVAQRGRWMNLVLALQPRACSDGSGRVALWQDGIAVADWHGCWGFSPQAQSSKTRGKVTSELGLDLGVYRRREALKQTVLFDNIRYGTTLADVMSPAKP